MPGHRLPLNLKTVIPRRDLVIKGGDQFITEKEFKRVKRGVYFSLNVAIHQIAWNLEPLGKDVQLSIAPDETNEHNAPLGYVLKRWELRSRGKNFRDIVESGDDLYWGFALQAAVAMMLVMKSLEILALPLERCITGKPLPPIKIFVVGIIETLDHAVPPWLFDRDEYRGHPIM